MWKEFYICGPCFTGIQQCTDDTGAVHCHLRSSCQLQVCPNSSCEASECRRCLADPLVDLSVYGEVFGDSGAEICKLLDGIKFLFIDGNAWGCLCILSQNIRLLETDGESKVLQA